MPISAAAMLLESREDKREREMKARLIGLTALALVWAGGAQAQEILLGYLPSGAGPFASGSPSLSHVV